MRNACFRFECHGPYPSRWRRPAASRFDVSIPCNCPAAAGPTPRFASLQRTGDFIIDGVLPIFSSGQAELIDDRHGVSAVVLIEPAHGHTLGQFTVRIEGGGREAILSADLMHHPLQLRYLDWSTRDGVRTSAYGGEAEDICSWWVFDWSARRTLV